MLTVEFVGVGHGPVVAGRIGQGEKEQIEKYI